MKSVDQVAQEVIQGSWGNGQARFNKLSSAGYVWQVVQNRVNEMLGSSYRYAVPAGSSGASSSSINAYIVNESPLSVSNITKAIDGSLDDIDNLKIKFSGSWSFSDNIKNGNNSHHILRIGVCWDWILADGSTRRIRGKYVGTDVTSDDIEVVRRDFFPSTRGSGTKYEQATPSGLPIRAIRLKVFGGNDHTDESNSPAKTSSYNFVRPKAPYQEITFDDSKDEITFKYDNDLDVTNTSNRAERYWTKTTITEKIHNTKYTGSGPELFAKEISLATNSTSNNKSKSFGPYRTNSLEIDGGSVDITPVQAGDYVLFEFVSRNEGFWGTGLSSRDEYGSGLDGNLKTDERYVISKPSIATIKKISRIGNNVAVYIDTNSESIPYCNAKPYVTVKLYKAQATLDDFNEKGVNNLSWSAVSNATGDYESEVLVEPLSSALKVDRGKYTWYRVESKRGSFTEVSEPMRADFLFTPEPTAAGTTVSIDGVSVNSNGESINLTLSWSPTDEAEGTEISYALVENAWDVGSKAPSTVKILDTDAESNGSTTYKLSGLTTDATYYIRARRYLSRNNSFGIYTGTFSATPTAGVADDGCNISAYTVAKGNENITATVIWEDAPSAGTKMGTQFLWSSVEDPVSRSTKSASTFDIDDDASATNTKSTQLVIHSIEAGTTTYLRARRYQINLDNSNTKIYSKIYSDLVQIPITAEDDICGIIAINENEDGTSLKVTVGWNEDDSTGTEISWSDKSYAWNSSGSPSTFNVNWDGESGENNGYVYQTDAVISGLTSGTAYYLRARRYQSGSNNTYGPYTPISTATPYAIPKNLIVSCDSLIAKDQELSVSWTFSSDSDQTSFMIFDRAGIPDGTVDSNGVIINGDTIANENTYDNSYTISNDIIQKYAVNNVFSFAVVVVTGGGSVQSSTVQVNLADAPTCTVAMNSSETDTQTEYKVINSAKDISFTVASLSKNYNYIFRLLAMGSSITLPDKTYYQEADDVLWNEEVQGGNLTWTENSDGTYSTAYTISDAFDNDSNYLVDQAYYIVQVYAIDPDSGLAMTDPAETVFRVIYKNKAYSLSDETSCVPGNAVPEVAITPILSDNNSTDDHIYIYRHTSFGNVLVAKDVEAGKSIIDKFAPYYSDGDMYYIIMVKSKDGDIQYMNFPYYIKRTSVRFDWGNGKYVEIPYNLKVSDSIEKNFERRTYLDGTSSGFWSKGYKRTGSITTELFRLHDMEELGDDMTNSIQNKMLLLRELAIYDGPVFVRCPDGSAYEADVEISGLDYSYDSSVYGITIKTTEISLTDEFMIHVDTNEAQSS